ncbi:response regulator transcription factor [Glycomyces sp. NPDC021274]|uniref:response regulator transcription factor n=1 Tax=Glycomyces sp. NPDC021274 TaxID=3155120 RepID=UPI0033D19595
MRILLVEDDRDLGPVLALGLRNEAYAVDLAQTCAEAEDLLCSNDFDVACLDLGLPDGDGLELLRRLGADPALRRPRRVLVLTARDAVDDRVAGLDAGADDYLVKPFSFQELAARLRALSRRADVRDAVLAVGDLRLDAAAHRAWRGGVELDLTPREFSMLRYLMHHPGRTVSAEELLEHVWDANADPFTASVRVILSRLRRKLGEPGPISTVNGVGYVLRATP